MMFPSIEFPLDSPLCEKYYPHNLQKILHPTADERDKRNVFHVREAGDRLIFFFFFFTYAEAMCVAVFFFFISLLCSRRYVLL